MSRIHRCESRSDNKLPPKNSEFSLKNKQLFFRSSISFLIIPKLSCVSQFVAARTPPRYKAFWIFSLNDLMLSEVLRPPKAVGISFASSTATPCFSLTVSHHSPNCICKRYDKAEFGRRPRRSKILFCSVADEHLLNSVSKN